MYLKSIKYDANMQKKKWLSTQLYICIMLYFIKCVFLKKKNHSFIPNKILNILSKTKKW
jgi:hypothetical protein